jgi:hypothetical protein
VGATAPFQSNSEETPTTQEKTVMPKATVSTETVRKQLKSAPPDGYVVLRQLSYSQMMKRRDLASRAYTELPSSERKLRELDTVKQYMEVVNQKIMEFEFANCIVEHNLQDEDGNLFDFTNPMSFDVLNPKVGLEIDRYIEEMNQEDEYAAVPLDTPPISSLPDSKKQPSESSIH